MRTLAFALTLGLVLTQIACQSEVDVASAPPTGQIADIAGTYEVSGLTVVTTTGDERQISGTMILAQEGDRYSATFNLGTMYPIKGGGVVKAEVIGRGGGRVTDSALLGNARTQIVASTVPGIDPGFAFIKRDIGTSIVSSTSAIIQPDGSITVEIANQPEEGAEYIPTHTTLNGIRVAKETAR